MAFYMLGACRRNAAFMYIGVASKAASALGLHVTDQYRHFSAQVQSVRYLVALISELFPLLTQR